jgi:hypothetical protein
MVAPGEMGLVRRAAGVGPLPRYGRALCCGAGVAGWVRAARDAGAWWDANPRIGLALGSRPGSRVLLLPARRSVSGIGAVTLESNSGYGRIWFFVLDSAGLAGQLVNAR